MKKLSKTQYKVLDCMARGHKLHVGRGGGSWLDTRSLGQVHGNTVEALHRRGYIERADTDKTPWYRRDYVITEAGRAALEAVA